MRVLLVLVACLTYFSGGALAQSCSSYSGDNCPSTCFQGSYDIPCGAQVKYCTDMKDNCGEGGDVKCWKDGSNLPVQTWSSCVPSELFGPNGKFKPSEIPNSSNCPSNCENGYEWVNVCGLSCDAKTACCPDVCQCKGGQSSGGSTTGSPTSGGSTTGSQTSGSQTSGSQTSGGSCSNTQCPNGFYCQVQGNNAVCVPQQPSTSGGHQNDPCDTVQCPSGYHCKSRDGFEAECKRDEEHTSRPTHRPKPPHDSDKYLCDNVHCPRGYKCNAKNGVARCTAGYEVPRVCRNTQCPTGYRCEDHNRNPICVAEERENPDNCLTCSDVNCEASGLVCVMTRARCKVGAAKCCDVQPTCIKPSTIAGSTIASIASTIASTGSTGATSPCSVAQCPTGYVCVAQNNVAVCLPRPTTTGSTSDSSASGSGSGSGSGSTSESSASGSSAASSSASGSSAASSSPSSSAASSAPSSSAASSAPSSSAASSAPSSSAASSAPSSSAASSSAPSSSASSSAPSSSASSSSASSSSASSSSASSAATTTTTTTTTATTP
ncbi:hypothetical protein ACTFIR_006163 [Dictyostelium discoideum]